MVTRTQDIARPYKDILEGAGGGAGAAGGGALAGLSIADIVAEAFSSDDIKKKKVAIPTDVKVTPVGSLPPIEPPEGPEDKEVGEAEVPLSELIRRSEQHAARGRKAQTSSRAMVRRPQPKSTKDFKNALNEIRKQQRAEGKTQISKGHKKASKELVEGSKSQRAGQRQQEVTRREMEDKFSEAGRQRDLKTMDDMAREALERTGSLERAKQIGKEVIPSQSRQWGRPKQYTKNNQPLPKTRDVGRHIPKRQATEQITDARSPTTRMEAAMEELHKRDMLTGQRGGRNVSAKIDALRKQRQLVPKDAPKQTISKPQSQFDKWEDMARQEEIAAAMKEGAKHRPARYQSQSTSKDLMVRPEQSAPVTEAGKSKFIDYLMKNKKKTAAAAIGGALGLNYLLKSGGEQPQEQIRTEIPQLREEYPSYRRR